MKSQNHLLHSLALELARISEVLRQREPKTAEACEALLGIRRQLAAASEANIVNSQAGAATDAANNTGNNTANNTAKPRKKSRLRQKQLMNQLISDTERLTLMLVSEQATAEAASETFAEFRQAVVATAGERRKHLNDLSYLHSISIGASETIGVSATIVAELEDMFRRAGGTIIADYSEEHKSDFDVSGKGSQMKVLRPAYTATNADGRTMLVARGLIEMSAAEVNTGEVSTGEVNTAEKHAASEAGAK